MYRFTTKLGNMVCRMCESQISKNFSSGGVGAVCEKCYQKRRELDLIEEGIIRNIQQVSSKRFIRSSYIFEANIDDVWFSCSQPCGDWSYVSSSEIFSVPVGWYELDDLYEKHCQTIETVSCKWCGIDTTMLGTEECNGCWELRHRIESNTPLAKKMIEELQK